ncbi:MAG: glycoside hydrolase family 3 N-terminal domain-containing protein [Candidatus Promineifilaceae bacterium]|nr:glycoside hydrolase family 3 N-terminal domain-containing protein [Candidatus Promineifilaceae bacterium]
MKTRVDELLNEMTLAEKIGQMTQADKRALQPADVTRWFIGSILSGGGSNPAPNNPQTWAGMVADYQEAALRTRLGIPLVYGVDAVHGHSNVVGATIFPHNIGLGATRDSTLVERIGRATALETSATGVFWNFAPCVAVPQDIRWGRTYEGYGSDPGLVAELGAACLRGLQGELGAPGTNLGCPKHFVGDGGTGWGTTQQYEWLSDSWQAADDRYKIDQGDTQVDEVTLRRIHLKPYLTAIENGARSIMVSFSSWNGAKMHGHRYLLTDVLKSELGFDGFLVSDWRAIDQLSPDYYSCVVNSVNAGLDMIMVPFEYERFITTLTKAVEAGDVPLERVDDAVRRILTVKEALGLFQRTAAQEPSPAILGADEHRQLAREAVRKSLVLLKNDDDTLPLAQDVARLIVAGPAADSVGLQCGGWTIEWLGGEGDITPGVTILEAVQQVVSAETMVDYSPKGNFSDEAEADVGLVCLHEAPYAEGVGDRADLHLTGEQVSLLHRVRDRCRRMVVILISGRPLIITEQLPLADAWLAAWLPGTEAQGIADVLFGDHPPRGKLSYAWPRTMGQIGTADDASAPVSDEDALFPFGYGLTFE